LKNRKNAQKAIGPGRAWLFDAKPPQASRFVAAVEGGFELPIEGQPTRMLNPGDGYQIPAGIAHGGGKAGSEKSRILITYVVEKGKPLATPA